MIKHTSRGEREGDTMSERGRGIQSEGERVVAIRERYGGEYRETRGGKKEESERGVEHQIHIFYVRGGYFQRSSKFFIFCKARLRFIV
jgi:hypothetical protein